MKRLFLIDGAAGTGKTDLLEHVKAKYGTGRTSSVVSKFTTRPHRLHERKLNLTLDLEFISVTKFKKLAEAPGFYQYRYGNYYYGFPKERLDGALSRAQNVFVIVRDLALVRKLKQDYQNVRTITVFVHTDSHYVVDRLKEDEYDEEAIKLRLDRQHLVWDDYLRHPQIYDEIILNNSCRNDFYRLIDGMLEKYANDPPDVLSVTSTESHVLPFGLIGFKSKMIERLRNYPYERNIFLMMKFRNSNRLMFEFIKDEICKRSFNCVRADLKEWNITDNVYNPIAVLHCCRYGIALFDEPEKENNFSPNVAYELGMMHLQRKRCLILRHSALPSMPFDLIKDLHRSYSKDLEVRNHVLSWLSELETGNN